MGVITQCERCREYNAVAVDFRNQASKAQADYAALLARHTALVEAVAAARNQIQMMRRELPKTIGDVNIPLLMEDLAEVDRLIADCKGEE